MSKIETWIKVDQDGNGWKVEGYYNDGDTVQRQLPPVITNFCCPVCGSAKFEAQYQPPRIPNFDIHTPIGPGQNYGPQTTSHPIIGYRCPSCTTHFDDPVKFSKNKPAEVVPPVATPSPQERLIEERRERLLLEKRERSGGNDAHPSHRIRSTFLLFIVLDSKESGPKPQHICVLCDATDVPSEDLHGSSWGDLISSCSATQKQRAAYDKNPEAFMERFITDRKAKAS